MTRGLLWIDEVRYDCGHTEILDGLRPDDVPPAVELGENRVCPRCVKLRVVERVSAHNR